MSSNAETSLLEETNTELKSETMAVPPGEGTSLEILSSGGEDDQVDEDLERLRARRRYFRKKITGPGGNVNTWDVPEFMPGAKPRADPRDRERFVRRSIQVFREQQAAKRQQEIEYDLVEEEKEAVRLTLDLDELQCMFPAIDIMVLQETYLQHKCDKHSCVEELLAVTGIADSPRRIKTISIDEFPSLSSKAISHARENDEEEEFTRKPSYQSVLSKSIIR